MHAFVTNMQITQEYSNLFSTGGGESLAQETKIPFLGESFLWKSISHCSIVLCHLSTGRIPLDPRLAMCLESGRDFSEQHANTAANAALTAVVKTLLSPIGP